MMSGSQPTLGSKSFLIWPFFPRLFELEIFVDVFCRVIKKALSHVYWTTCHDLNRNHWIKIYLLCSLTGLVNVSHAQYVWTYAAVISVIVFGLQICCFVPVTVCSQMSSESNIKTNKKHFTPLHVVRLSVAPLDKTSSAKNFQGDISHSCLNFSSDI